MKVFYKEIVSRTYQSGKEYFEFVVLSASKSL